MGQKRCFLKNSDMVKDTILMSETMSEMFLRSDKSEVIFLTSDETLMVGTSVFVGHGKRTCEMPFILN